MPSWRHSWHPRDDMERRDGGSSGATRITQRNVTWGLPECCKQLFASDSCSPAATEEKEGRRQVRHYAEECSGVRCCVVECGVRRVCVQWKLRLASSCSRRQRNPESRRHVESIILLASKDSRALDPGSGDIVKRPCSIVNKIYVQNYTFIRIYVSPYSFRR